MHHCLSQLGETRYQNAQGSKQCAVRSVIQSDMAPQCIQTPQCNPLELAACVVYVPTLQIAAACVLRPDIALASRQISIDRCARGYLIAMQVYAHRMRSPEFYALQLADRWR